MKDKQIIWLTGASSGIGRHTALRLTEEGHTVVVTARSKDKLEELRKDAEKNSGEIIVHTGDVTDSAAMIEIVEKIEQDIGPLDLAIFNAGTYYPDGVENFTAETLRKQYIINVFGVANCLEPVLKLFKERKSGHIAIMASVAGYRGLPQSISYGSTKAALINMAEALAAECKNYNIKVQVINPGFIKTPLTDKNDFPMPMLMPVEKASEKLVKGLKKNKFEITFPWQFSLLLKFIGLILPRGVYISMMSKVKPN